MFDRFLLRFKWYRLCKVKRALRAIELGEYSALFMYLPIILTYYHEFVFEPMYHLRFNSEFSRVTDLLASLASLTARLDGERKPDPEERISNSLLLDDWFVDNHCYRYPQESFEKELSYAIATLSEDYNGLNYSMKQYYEGQYSSLFVTLRNYVAVIGRQI